LLLLAADAAADAVKGWSYSSIIRWRVDYRPDAPLPHISHVSALRMYLASLFRALFEDCDCARYLFNFIFYDVQTFRRFGTMRLGCLRAAAGWRPLPAVVVVMVVVMAMLMMRMKMPPLLLCMYRISRATTGYLRR
jgi:hypothetical protein